MPLPRPTNRALAHTRVVTCKGFKRNDALWDIEGQIVDTKPYRFENKDRGGWIESGEALHDMSIRLTINLNLEVVDAKAIIDHSPYNYCKCVVATVKNLIGLSIAPGWTVKSKLAMGANRGCTHLTELLGPVATTAIQTISSEKMQRNTVESDRSQTSKSFFIDTCHALAACSPVVKDHWPEQYREKKPVLK